MLMRREWAKDVAEVSDIQSLRIDRAIRERAICIRDIDMASVEIACDSSDAGWFCLSVRPGREMAVERLMDANHVHALIPLCKGKEKYRRGRTIPAPVLPVMIGYILVRVAPSVEAFRGLVGLEQVQGVVGGLDRPFRIRDKEVNRFKAKAEQGAYDYRVIRVSFALGEIVKVTDGPFAGFNAMVISIDNLRMCRISVEVNIFGRPTPVDLEVAQIEKL